MPVLPVTLLDSHLTPGGQATVRRLTAGLSGAQVENMSPILQLLRLKRWAGKSGRRAAVSVAFPAALLCLLAGGE